MVFQVFLIIYLVSLLGTIPPATINISVMQLTLKRKVKSGLFLGLGAALVDTIYAGLAVQVQRFLSERIEVTNYFYLLAAVVLIALGIASLVRKPAVMEVELKEDERLGFAKGVILGILNPLAMPFWLGVTSYLQLIGLISLNDGLNYWSYIIAVFLGEFTLLAIIVKIGKRFKSVSENRTMLSCFLAQSTSGNGCCSTSIRIANFLPLLSSILNGHVRF